MYHALLTNRYLTSRVIPFVAVGAVALCVALVIIVVSVMTGFLDMVKSSGRTLMGDVVVFCPINGIPHYERLITRLEKLPEVEAAAPVVDSFGLLKMPFPDGPQKATETVQIWGIDERFARVTGFKGTLHWKSLEHRSWQWRRLFEEAVGKHWKEILPSLTSEQRIALLREVLRVNTGDGRTPPSEDEARNILATLTDDEWDRVFLFLRDDPETLERVLEKPQWDQFLSHDERLVREDQILADGVALKRGSLPGIVLGIHVAETNKRQSDGTYMPMAGGYWWMPAFQVTLTTLPVTEGGLGSEPESVIFQVVNEFMSGVYQIDDMRVMIPLDIAQRMLHLDEGQIVDEDDPTKILGPDPAKATMVLIRSKEGVTPEQLCEAAKVAYEDFYGEIAHDPNVLVSPPVEGIGLTIKTWAQQQAQFIGPVEKERELMRTLFSIVYVVCAALVLSIFWAIVYEKTRDIGILRSIGASRGGIVWIFLRYGLVVGVIGSIVGVGLGYVIIHNINKIHDALAQPPLGLAIGVLILGVVAVVLTIITSLRGALLPLVLGSLLSLALLGLCAGVWMLRSSGGVIIWDPSVYYFTKIPNAMDIATAVTTVIGAVIFSLLGAAIPAAKAADTDPVRALRYE